MAACLHTFKIVTLKPLNSVSLRYVILLTLIWAFEEKIQLKSYLSCDVDIILGLPFFDANPQDRLIWHFFVNWAFYGPFSVPYDN